MMKAVIFDLDGTLLNTLEDIADSVNAVLETFHLPPRTYEQVRKSVGNGVKRLLNESIPGGETHPQFQEILEYYVPYYEAHCKIKTAPYQGILEMMAALKDAGMKMAIVSNKGDGAVKELSREFFMGLVDSSVGERENIRRKPSPDSVLEAMRELGVSKEESLYVGDSEVDFDTARNAGIPVALVTWGFREREDLKAMSPAYLIDEPSQLCDALLADS
ncbi:MAG: HAD-IA family hydrolase [Lachnospiraceae bacterium]|nr:HAD-IA family hydrolase [Lachnospiraceae bacterium]